MKNFIVGVWKLCWKNNVFGIAVLCFVVSTGWFFIDAFTPDVTEINGGGASFTQEEGAQFYVPSSLKVKSMDGHSVTWTRRLSANAITVLLPAAPHTFTLDFKESIGNTDYSAKDLKISADFAPGKYYRFNYSMDTNTNMISYSIKEAEPVAFKTGFDPPLWLLVIMVIAFVVTVIVYYKEKADAATSKAWRLIPGNVFRTAEPHPEIVLNHAPGKPKIFIGIEEDLKIFDRVVSLIDAGTWTLNDLTSVFLVVANDLGLKGIKTSDITEAQYGKPIKTFVSQKPNSAILYSFVLNGKKMIGYWLRNQYLYTLE